MTTKFQESGEVKTWTNSSGADVVSGQVVKMGSMIGVAITDIAQNADGAVKVTGVFASMPKTTGTAWTVGLGLNWDVSTGKFDSIAATAATGDIVGCCQAWEAAASGDATGVVLFSRAPTVT